MSLIRFLSVCLLFKCISSQGLLADAAFPNHGPAALVSRARAFYAINGEKGERLAVMWLRDIVDSSMLVVDLETEVAEQIPLPVRLPDSPYATFLHNERVIYAVTGGYFWGFDAIEREWILQEKVGDREAMVVAPGDDGLSYAATYPKGHLMAVDPETNEVREFGQINEESWPQYPRSLAADSDGWIYVGIGNVASQVVAFHTESGEIRRLASGDSSTTGTGFVFLAEDGNVYGRLQTRGKPHRFQNGIATEIEAPTADPVALRGGTQENYFPEFPAGGKITDWSFADGWLELPDENGKTRRIAFDYESEGARVYAVTAAGNGKIYGSTGHPLRFFQFDPETGVAQSRGLNGWNGHINALVSDGLDVYGAIYTRGHLIHYDLRQSIEATSHGKNPRILTMADDTVLRPFAIGFHPNGREIAMTGGGAYGVTGGGMMIYDLDVGKRERIEHDAIVQYHATRAFVFPSDKLLVGGTTVAPGTGGVRKASEAVIYLMDWESREVVYQEVPVAGDPTVLDLIVGSDELVYGLTSGGTIFAFDPETREIVAQSSAKEYGRTTGGQGSRVLHLASDGQIYALFAQAIVRIGLVDSNGEIGHEKVGQPPAGITTGGTLLGDRIYYASGSRLWSYAVPVITEK